MTEPMVSGWYRDPFGRHEKRYHTGAGWTEHVKDKGKAGIDPPHARISEVRVPRRAPTPPPAPIRAAPAVRAAVPAPSRPHAPVQTPPSAPARAPVPLHPAASAASRSSVAVAFPPTANRRAASSYLKPAPKIAPATTEGHRVRWPWVVVIIFVLVAIAVATGVGLSRGTAEEQTVAKPTAHRAAHTITDVQYNFVNIGTPRARVIRGLGKPAVDRAEYQRVFPAATTNASCAYYYGTASRISYAFCFDGHGQLVSKTTRSLVATVPAPKAKPAAKASR